MNDLISRQAAIETIGILLEQSEDDEHDKTWNNAIRSSINAVKHHLPSAQPEISCSEIPNSSDAISRQAAIDRAVSIPMFGRDVKMVAVSEIKNLPSAQPEQRWIPIKWHDCTDEDREKYGFSNDIVAVFDCEMPDDNQPILVTTFHGYVNQDVCYIDDGFSLDSGFDWIEDIKAWMPLPKPYAERREE